MTVKRYKMVKDPWDNAHMAVRDDGDYVLYTDHLALVVAAYRDALREILSGLAVQMAVQEAARVPEIAALIEAVEAGTAWDRLIGVRAFYTGGSIADCNAHERLALDAYNGSLDAAKALHEALLPGWFPGMSKNIHHGHWYAWVQDKATKHFSAEDNDPARAWLLAILRAKEAGQ